VISKTKEADGHNVKHKLYEAHFHPFSACPYILLLYGCNVANTACKIL